MLPAREQPRTEQRQTEEQRQRAARAEARLGQTQARLAERNASLRGGLQHFERLQGALVSAEAEGRGLGALAQTALGTVKGWAARAGEALSTLAWPNRLGAAYAQA